MPKRIPDPVTSVRFTRDDKKIIAALEKKLGINVTSLVRQALRALAAKEGVTA
jgi:hypothetical protein